MSTPQAYLLLSITLFAIGIAIILIRKQPLIVLLGVELTLQAVNLALGALTSNFQDWAGQVTLFVLITIAVVELLAGLGLLLAREQRTQHKSRIL